MLVVRQRPMSCSFCISKVSFRRKRALTPDFGKGPEPRASVEAWSSSTPSVTDDISC
jgi:hypothetical protein